MKEKVFAYLQLMRFPNLFTSIADIVAGYLILRGRNINWAGITGALPLHLVYLWRRLHIKRSA